MPVYIPIKSNGLEIYDLTYDGTFFYGSNGTNTLFVLDLDLEIIISTFNVPQNVKATTYECQFVDSLVIPETDIPIMQQVIFTMDGNPILQIQGM